MNMNIHRVKKLTIGEIEKNISDNRVYYTKDITVKKENGENFELTLFSDTKEVLSV